MKNSDEVAALTITQDGHVLTETIDGITMPADYSFATVNDYVHGRDVHFEDLVALCLGMANEVDRLTKSLKFARRFIPSNAVDLERWHAGKSPWHATEIVDAAIAAAKGSA